MTTTSSPTPDLQLVVGYDGSPPGNRALDAAIALLRGRTGRITVVYVAHMYTAAMMSSGAVAEIEESFDEVEQELRSAAGERLGGQESWGFERREGLIPDELLSVAEHTRDAHPNDEVVIVVGSSSHAMHRVVGSVAVSLARHSPVPLVIVP